MKKTFRILAELLILTASVLDGTYVGQKYVSYKSTGKGYWYACALIFERLYVSVIFSSKWPFFGANVCWYD